MVEKADLKDASFEDAVVVFRRVLTDQSDNSVTIVCTGFSTNLAALLDAPSLGSKGSAGRELVKEKVFSLVLMAGLQEDSKERSFNVLYNIDAFREVIEEWPTPVYLVPSSAGERVYLNLDRLMSLLSPDDPYQSLIPLFKERKHFVHDSKRIPSWDQLAFLFAVAPKDAPFSIGPPMKVVVAPNGTVSCSSDPTAFPRRYALEFSEEESPERTSELLMDWYSDSK